MAIRTMTRVSSVGDHDGKAWEDEVSLAAVANSDPIMIPAGITKISVCLSMSGGGKGKIQATTDKVNTVINGTPVWMDWTLGEVAVNAQDSAEPCTAIRLAQTFAGATKLTVRAQ